MVGGLLLVGAAVWFATSWIDTGGDATCGSVVRSSIWLDQYAGSGCARVMSIRAFVAAATFLSGVALVVAALARWPRVLARAWPILAASVGVCVVLLVVNEIVRSGGAL